MDSLKKFTNLKLNESDEIETPVEKTSEIVVKNYLKELCEMFEYWFENSRIKTRYELSDIKKDDDSTTIWTLDKTDGYIFRIKFYQYEPLGNIKKLEDINMKVDILSPSDESLLKTTEVIIKTDDINELYLRKKLRKLRKSIISKPKSRIDARRFKRNQGQSLRTQEQAKSRFNN